MKKFESVDLALDFAYVDFGEVDPEILLTELERLGWVYQPEAPPGSQEDDLYELAWWREEFSCRFGPGELPRVGKPLYGRRFRLVEIAPDLESNDG